MLGPRLIKAMLEALVLVLDVPTPESGSINAVLGSSMLEVWSPVLRPKL